MSALLLFFVRSPTCLCLYCFLRALAGSPHTYFYFRAPAYSLFPVRVLFFRPLAFPVRYCLLFLSVRPSARLFLFARSPTCLCLYCLHRALACRQPRVSYVAFVFLACVATTDCPSACFCSYCSRYLPALLPPTARNGVLVCLARVVPLRPRCTCVPPRFT